MARKSKSEPEKPPEEPQAPLKEAIPTDVTFEGKTLSGDIRDMLLMHMRDIKAPWPMLSEDEQADKIEAATDAGMDCVRRCLATLAATKFPHFNAVLGPWKVDKVVELKVFVSPTAHNIELLALHSKGNAMIVIAEPQDYYGERAPAKPDKDQKEFPLGYDEDESGED